MTSEPFRRQLAEYEAVAAAWAVNRMERGRDLTEHEIAVWLADRQTPIRHGTADIAVEIADQLRTELAAEKALATATVRRNTDLENARAAAERDVAALREARATIEVMSGDAADLIDLMDGPRASHRPPGRRHRRVRAAAAPEAMTRVTPLNSRLALRPDGEPNA